MIVFQGIRKQAPAEYQAKGITNGPNAPDYEGVQFSDGTVVMRWLTLKHSTSIFPDMEMFQAIHGHPEYGTEIVYTTVTFADK
jgi:hypothetical protein